MNCIKTTMVFTTGVILGGLTAWYYTKQKYEKIVNEEASELREAIHLYNSYKNPEDDKCEKQPENDSELPVEPAKSSINMDQLKSRNSRRDENVTYARPSFAFEPDEAPKKEINMYRPYVIDPDDYGEEEEYNKRMLIYYADEVLTDDMDIPIDDVEGTVGYDALDRFGEYEPDCVCVRNDILKSYYEITLDVRRWEDVVRRTRPDLDWE